MSVEDWQRSLALNLTAPFLLICAALPHLRDSRGSIVNTGSIEGWPPTRATRRTVPPGRGCTG